MADLTVSLLIEDDFEIFKNKALKTKSLCITPTWYQDSWQFFAGWDFKTAV